MTRQCALLLQFLGEPEREWGDLEGQKIYLKGFFLEKQVSLYYQGNTSKTQKYSSLKVAK